MKLIHIVENLDRGAVENWIVNIFLESRKVKPDWEWTFYCILGNPGRLDEKVLAAGGKIIYSPVTVSEKVKFLRHLRAALIRGHYDIVHAHHDYLSGFYLLATVGLKFKRRILHIHNNDKGLPVGNRFLYKILTPVFRWTGIKMSDDVLGISEHTLNEFRMGYSRYCPNFKVLYYGIDLAPYSEQPDREALRASLNLPKGSRILLFTGRMIDEKNPMFVVRILQELLKRRNDVYAVFAGKGPLEESVMKYAVELNIKEHVRLVGWIDKMGNLMKSSDVFIFPRLETPKEGLGLVVVEAQAAGLPAFITRGIVKDAVIIPEMVFYHSLDHLDQWVHGIEKILESGPALSQEAALFRMQNSAFELSHAANNLIQYYERKITG
jgi:glycosyltransferase involved in cell wall biosynthesis